MSVTFGSVQVREHERVLGSPNTDAQAGLSLGWNYVQHEPISSISFKERRDEIQFQPTSLSERLDLLRRYGYTIDELENSEKQKKYELSSFRQIKKSCSKLLRSSRMMKTKLIAAQ